MLWPKTANSVEPSRARGAADRARGAAEVSGFLDMRSSISHPPET